MFTSWIEPLLNMYRIEIHTGKYVHIVDLWPCWPCIIFVNNLRDAKKQSVINVMSAVQCVGLWQWCRVFFLSSSLHDLYLRPELLISCGLNRDTTDTIVVQEGEGQSVSFFIFFIFFIAYLFQQTKQPWQGPRPWKVKDQKAFLNILKPSEFLIRLQWRPRCSILKSKTYNPMINQQLNEHELKLRVVVNGAERVIVLCVYAAHACSFNYWSDL